MYEYILLRRRITAGGPKDFGKLAHIALMAWWRGGLKAAVKAMTDMSDQMTVEVAARLRAMLATYNPLMDNGTPARDRFEVVDLEKEFSGVKIVNPLTGRAMTNYFLCGKVDGILRDKVTGELWLLEHKTTSEEILGFGVYWQRLSIDVQIAYYMLATGTVGVLYDVLRKPDCSLSQIPLLDAERLKIVLDANGSRVMTKQGKPRQTGDKDLGYVLQTREETGDELYDRCVAKITENLAGHYQFREIRLDVDDLEEAKSDLWAQAHMLSECAQLNRWPRNSNSCRSFFGMCEYLGVCTKMESINDDALFRTKEATNEELAKPA